MNCSPPGSSALEFFRQEYCSGLPFPSSGDLPNPGIDPGSPALQADSLQSEPPGKPNLKIDIIKKNKLYRLWSWDTFDDVWIVF